MRGGKALPSEGGILPTPSRARESSNRGGSSNSSSSRNGSEGKKKRQQATDGPANKR